METFIHHTQTRFRRVKIKIKHETYCDYIDFHIILIFALITVPFKFVLWHLLMQTYCQIHMYTVTLGLFSSSTYRSIFHVSLTTSCRICLRLKQSSSAFFFFFFFFFFVRFLFIFVFVCKL